jgi:16S rRNA (uracil1498-N3)-methyltransferase
MQLFYCPEPDATSCLLDPEESRHCVKVLRLRVGDTLYLTDGRGHLIEGRLTGTRPDQCVVGIISKTLQPKRNSELHIAIAPPKNPDRLEWFVEKATEIGVDRITPLICEHAERKTLRTDRLHKIMLSAMKQSLNTWAPQLEEPAVFSEFIQRNLPGQRFIAWCESGEENQLFSLCNPRLPGTVMVGPEGDFSESEVKQARDAGFVPVSLGASRLRIETAGLVACHTVRLLEGIAKSVKKTTYIKT